MNALEADKPGMVLSVLGNAWAPLCIPVSWFIKWSKSRHRGVILKIKGGRHAKLNRLKPAAVRFVFRSS